MTAPRRLWPAVVTALAGIAVLVALGAWQVRRLHWKEGLLAAIAARQAAPAVDLATLAPGLAAGSDIEFVKARAAGHYLEGSEKLLISVYDGNPGWEVVAPFLTDAGDVILVDRGVVPDALRDPARRPPVAGAVTVEGLLSVHPAGRGPFSPDNDPMSNLWFWWDLRAMLATTAIPPGARPLPVVLHFEPVAGSTAFPRPRGLASGLPNNHRQYAITWFALALVLVVIAGLYVRGQMKKPGA